MEVAQAAGGVAVRDSENPYGNAPGRVSRPFRDPEVRTITIRERAGVFGADARGRR